MDADYDRGVKLARTLCARAVLKYVLEYPSCRGQFSAYVPATGHCASAGSRNKSSYLGLGLDLGGARKATAHGGKIGRKRKFESIKINKKKKLLS